MHWGTEEHKRMKVKFMLEQYAFTKQPGLKVPYYPDQVDLDISNRCNLKCITCFHSIDEFASMPDMTMETVHAVLDQAEGISSSITIGNHGEPFLHKDVLDIMREIKKRGFFLNLINNGTLLTEENARAIIEIGVDRLSFSLDSVDPKVYPKLRRGAVLDKTLANILRFIRLNYESGLPIFTNISTVNSKLAGKSERDIRDFFSELPVHVVYTSDILNFGDGLALRDETKFVKLGYEKITDPEKLPVCVNGFDRILIRPNGNVSLCPIDWGSLHVLGNVHDAPYTELWNNEKAQEFRQALISRDYSTIEKNGTLCSRCDGKWVLDAGKRPESVHAVLVDNLCDTKDSEELLAPEYGERLAKAQAWVESLREDG